MVGARVNLSWIITGLLTALLTITTAMFSIQRQDLRDLSAKLDGIFIQFSSLQTAQSLSYQDREQIRTRLENMERKQQQIIGVLSSLDPKGTSALLQSK